MSKPTIRKVPFFTRLKEAIDASPLGYIQGNCRLAHLTPDEWATYDTDEDFFKGFDSNTRTIPFAVGNQKLGELVIEKDYIERCTTDDEENLEMILHIPKDGLKISIFISCQSGFPGHMEFAEFTACYEPDSNKEG